ncbi:hypothetical protein [Parasporobacterium paucivorans]|uniref:Uncharacterized protein n=1 Tax=Parasporobacterium paucivorans DSM 15970 TaxID=1122934 RepID=A0A1M6DJR7_9FIRM|nr:hypothetical protein [Parasporobacterium paucivorans]SHI73248.1 hypothetical protein SAMN02745691_00728 [Parasporobacterium paucivorans DSM 15970]
MKKKLLAFFVAMFLLVGTSTVNVMAAEPTQGEVDAKAQTAAEYLTSTYAGTVTPDQYLYVFLIAASGIDSSTISQEFLDSVKNNIDTNGKLMTVGDNPTETPEFYGSIIMTLKACGIDPTNVAGRNLLTDLTESLASSDFTQYTGNPYELVYLMSTLQYYKTDIEGAEGYIESVKEAIMSFYYEDEYSGQDYVEDPVGSGNWVMQDVTVQGTGFYHYGFSDDTNAKMISALKMYYESDSEIKAIVDTLIANMKKSANEQYQVDGYGFGYNSDSTGLVLSALSIYGDQEAANYYNGLLKFESPDVQGAYLYDEVSTEPDAVYATRDALEGLISFERMLTGNESIYDLSSYDVVADDEVQKTGIDPVVIVAIVVVVIVILATLLVKTKKKKNK